MIEKKFDIVTVKKYKEDINNIFKMVNELLYGVGIEKINKEDAEVLISSFEKVVRSIGMYNDIFEQVIEDKEITTSDPQSYISSNLDCSYTLTEKIYSKYKHLSRFGK
jgi:hypothetical protein